MSPTPKAASTDTRRQSTPLHQLRNALGNISLPRHIMPTTMIIRLPPRRIGKLHQLQRSRTPRIHIPIHMHRRHRYPQMLRHLREIQPKHIGRVQRHFPVRNHPLGIHPPVQAGPEDGVRGRLLRERSTALLVHLPRLLTDFDPHIFKHLQRYTSADENRDLERKRLMGGFGLVVEAETRDQGTPLRETHDAIVWSVPGDLFAQPDVGFSHGVGGGIVPEGVVGGWVEEVDAGGGGGGEEAVDEVEGEVAA